MVPPKDAIQRIRATYDWAMPEHALKEWASVIGAMLSGEQVVMLRKGGIGEARFDVPYRRFFLLPTYLHQRPELLTPAARDAYSAELARREEPGQNALMAYCEVHAVHQISEQTGLDALEGFHVLGHDYAESRLKWRPTQPLMAVVVRVHRVAPPVDLEMNPEMGGCVSWVALPDDIHAPAPDPVLDDATFTARALAIADAITLG